MNKLAYLSAALLVTTARFVPFDPGKAGWKTIKVGEVDAIEVNKDGNPIWIDANGAEAVIERDTIARLNREAQTHREAKEAAETKLAAYKDIPDPVKAKEAIDTVAALKQGDLIKAGEVENVKTQIKAEFTGQINDANKRAEDALALVDNLRIETAFGASKFIEDKLAIPRDIVQATFGQRFKVENGKIVAYGADGNKILSKTRIGEVADFDEALGVIVENYTHKDAIMKGGNQGGSGNQGGGGGNNSGKRTYRREEFDKLPVAEQSRLGMEAGEGKIVIID